MQTLNQAERDELVALHERQTDARLLLDAGVKAHADGAAPDALETALADLEQTIDHWIMTDVTVSAVYQAALAFVEAYRFAQGSPAPIQPDDPPVVGRFSLQIPLHHLACSRCQHIRHNAAWAWCAKGQEEFPALCAEYAV